jgi:hypothetical protein
MKFGAVEIDPAKNPAILDTATWNPKSAWDILCRLDDQYWRSPEYLAPRSTWGLPVNEHFMPYAGSFARYQGSDFFLASVQEGQHVFIGIGPDAGESVLGEPIGKKRLADGTCVAAYKTDAAIIDRYCRLINPDKGPKALGATPRLGIGTRMSTAVWPGVWRAMDRCSFSANAIQNSVRELNLLEDVWAGRPACANYLPGLGQIEEGHTGSTFEGLWVAGVLEALKTDTNPQYGADADHIMVKRGAQGMIQAKRVIDAACYYSFFTLDVSDILDYAAMERPIGKYWPALEVVGELYNHIKSLKDNAAFDLEISIDESPPDVGALESVTTEEELLFLLLEMQRRQIPLTHIAPNFGIVKGQDYRCPDGLEGLGRRVRKLCRIAADHAVLLDCHSGDDLKSATRKVIGRATDGQIHFKISPALQIIFAEALSDFDPEQFAFWWDDTLDYARRQRAAGSELACDCIHEYESGGNATPSPRHAVFRHYCFATVGRRDEHGQFIHREKFYTLPADFYQEYQRRVEYYLCEVAEDVFSRGS